MSSDESTGFFRATDADALLGELIAGYLKSVEAGQPQSRDELLAAHPQLADELTGFFANHDRVEQVAEPLRDPNAPPRRPIPPGAKLRYFGDYELLEEVAQGGMGVVYKARQISLNRLVAVKMILAGQLASEADVRRFQAEAEAAANLRHPGIVAIYEVGIHDGLHYFSMEYVEGQSLSQLIRDNPLPANKAAQYVRDMAEIVEYAHQQGVLHRDLKPSNVLIDTNDRVRITDFGLAKRVDHDSDLTMSGQIIGTPSYMSPEQAAAQHTMIGPTSDVFALGAILYELVAGRPPFRGETPVETMRQVQQDDAPLLRLMNPCVSRDMETICLKCLENEPRRRYQSGQALVDDLARYLRGEPIAARPAGRVSRTCRWCKRQPLVASLSAAVALSIVFGTLASTYFAWCERLVLSRESGLVDENRLLAMMLLHISSGESQVQLWDTTSGERIQVNSVECVAISPDGTKLVTVSAADGSGVNLERGN